MNIARTAVLICAATSITACGYNVKAIKSFQDSTTKLTNTYSDLVITTTKWCWDAHLYYRVSSSGNYTNESDLQNYLKEKCEPYEEKVKSILVSKQVVNAYAQALAATAGVSATSWNDDLAKMGSVAQTLKSGEGTALLTPDEVSATVKLAQFLSEIYITQKVKKKTVEIIQQNTALVNKHVGIMIDFAETMYPTDKQFLDSGYASAEIELKKASTIQTSTSKSPGRPLEDVVANRLKLHEVSLVRKSLKSSKEADPVVTSFKAAANSLIEANNDLEKNFTTLDEDEQLASVKEFAKRIKELNDAVKKL